MRFSFRFLCCSFVFFFNLTFIFSKVSEEVSRQREKVQDVRKSLFFSEVDSSKNLIFSSQKEPRKFDRISGDWSLKIGSRVVDEFRDNSRIVSMEVDPSFTYKFTPNFYARTRLMLHIRNARAQSTFQGSEALKKNEISAREFTLAYTPFSFLEIRAGSNSQIFLDAPFLIDGSIGFPGILEILEYDVNKNLKLQLFSQQSMPISYTGNEDRTIKESTPFFLTETFRVQAAWLDQFRAHSSLSYYHYTQLPSVVAQQSGLLGNSTTDTGFSNSQFVYYFNGFVFDVNGCYCLRLIQFQTGVQFLRNISAPRSAGAEGLKLYLKTKFYIWKKTTLTGLAEYFSNGANVAPAYYQNSLYGFSNRNGVVLGVSIFFEKFGFGLSSRYVRSDLISPSGPQSPGRDELRIQLETKRVVL